MPTVPRTQPEDDEYGRSLMNGGKAQYNEGGFFSGLMEMLGWKTTESKAFAPAKVKAPERTTYPSKEEAEFAQKSGFAYGTPSESYASGGLYRVLSSSEGAVEDPRPATNVLAGSLDKFNRMPAATKEAMEQYYMRAQLAAEGSALAKLGFDPKKVAVDIVNAKGSYGYRSGPDRFTPILGEYVRKHDDIYASGYDPSTIVHESIHRGMERLRHPDPSKPDEVGPYWKKEFDELYKGLGNEMTTRHLMTKKMGDPEAGKSEQVEQAQRYFDPTSWTGAQRLKTLEAMEKAAADYIAAKRPGGPR